MERYLTEDLGMPRNRIQLLLGSKENLSPEDPTYPSRAHIIGILLSLITNSNIARGDNIIVYYSGHGSYYPYHTEEMRNQNTSKRSVPSIATLQVKTANLCLTSATGNLTRSYPSSVERRAIASLSFLTVVTLVTSAEVYLSQEHVLSLP